MVLKPLRLRYRDDHYSKCPISYHENIIVGVSTYKLASTCSNRQRRKIIHITILRLPRLQFLRRSIPHQHRPLNSIRIELLPLTPSIHQHQVHSQGRQVRSLMPTPIYPPLTLLSNRFSHHLLWRRFHLPLSHHPRHPFQHPTASNQTLMPSLQLLPYNRSRHNLVAHGRQRRSWHARMVQHQTHYHPHPPRIHPH